MKPRTWFAGLAAATALAWVAWAAATPPEPSIRLPPGARGAFPVVRGAYHVHSVESDGTGAIGEIGKAAAAAGLDFVILTDHGDATRVTRPPRYYSRVLGLEEVEISTDDGHYAALGLPPAPYPLAGEGRDVVEDVARLGGFGIAAHPDSAKRDLQWREWSAPFPGLEWFNGDSQWRDEARWRLPVTFVRYLRRPAESVASLFDRPDAVLARWDALSQRRRVVGLAGHDAHQRLGLRSGTEPAAQRLYVKAPSYEQVFRAFTTAVELDTPLDQDAATDAAALLRAIRAGRVYTTMDAVASPGRFSFTGSSGTWTARMGDSIPLVGPITLRVRSNAPAGSSVVLFRNGEAVDTRRSGNLDWYGDRPGVYRVEIAVPGSPGRPPVPWLVSNAISIGVVYSDAPRPAVVDPEPWPAVTWSVENGGHSSATLAPRSAPDGPGIDIEFALGSARQESPFVATVTRDIDRLQRARVIAFRVQADRPMRASIQLRARSDNPDERWRRGFYADTTPRMVLVPLEDFRPVIEGIGARVPADRIGALMIVVDSTNTRPGGRGHLAIDQLRTGQ